MKWNKNQNNIKRLIIYLLIPTFIFINTYNNNRFSFANSDKFVNRPNTPPGQFRQQDHALDIIILQQVNVRAHLRDATHRHHHNILDLRVLLHVKPTREHHLFSYFFYRPKNFYNLFSLIHPNPQLFSFLQNSVKKLTSQLPFKS